MALAISISLSSPLLILRLFPFASASANAMTGPFLRQIYRALPCDRFGFFLFQPRAFRLADHSGIHATLCLAWCVHFLHNVHRRVAHRWITMITFQSLFLAALGTPSAVKDGSIFSFLKDQPRLP